MGGKTAPVRDVDGQCECSAGDSPVKSRVSTSVVTSVAGWDCNEVRSRVSISVGREMLLLRRGEVRRNDPFGASFCLVVWFGAELVDVLEPVERRDALDEVEVNGGCTRDAGAVF